MNKKVDLDELMYLLGEETTLEKFNQDSPQHTFSEKYERGKMEMINNENNMISNKENIKKKKTTFKRAMVLTAAVTAALGVSLTVYGIGKRISFTTSKNEKTGTLTYNIESDAPLNKIQEIKVTPEYLPAGYIESKNSPGKYHLNDDWKQGGMTICSGFNSTNFQDLYVSTVEDTTIGGVKAQILTREGIDYKYIVYLFYEEDGQIIKIYGTDKVPLEELKKVAENIKYEVVPGSYIDIAKNTIPDEEFETSIETTKVSGHNLFNIGEERNDLIDSAEGVKYTVNSIEVMDKLPELNPEGFNRYQVYLESINEDGTFKPYERVNKQWWENNKMNTETETIGMKFVYVTLTLTNTLDEDKIDMYFCPRVMFLNKNDDKSFEDNIQYSGGTHELQIENAPIYFDQFDYSGKHCRFCDIASNTSEEVTLVYAVDEDHLEDAYISFNTHRFTVTDPAYSTESYIKITK